MALGNPISLTDNVASRLVSATATAGQTSFTVSGGYRINAISVYRNGVKLSDNEDFTASDGSTVNLVDAANVDDTLDLVVTGRVYGASVGVQSGGVNIGAAKTLNFIGAGNTFSQTGDTIDISISGGGGGGGLGTAIKYSDDTTATPFSFFDREAFVTENLLLDTSKAGESDSYIVSVIPNINIVSGAAVTVGAGKTMIIDVLQIGDL